MTDMKKEKKRVRRSEGKASVSKRERGRDGRQ